MSALKKQQNMVGLPHWKARRFPYKKGGILSDITRRGASRAYYANVTYLGVRLRDCLKTTDRDEAQRRVIELKISIERGDYQRANKLFDDLVTEYRPPTKRKEGIVRVHLKPAFCGKKVGELDIDGFLSKLSKTHAQSSVSQTLAVMRAIGLDVPACKSEVTSKTFGIDQILEEKQVLDVIENHIIYKYRAFSLIAAYSMLRLKDILNLRKRDVDFKAGITIVPSKTKKKNPMSVFIPMSNKLVEAFGRIKVWPLRDNDLWFPDLKAENIAASVLKSFRGSKVPWGSFKQFRHFGACYLVNRGIPLEVIQELMHHTKIQTTQIYARVNREKLTQAMSEFDKNPKNSDTTQTQIGGQ